MVDESTKPVSLERPMSISEAHRDPATEFLNQQASKSVPQYEMPEISPSLKAYLQTHGMKDPLASTTNIPETKKFDNHVEAAWSKLQASAENPNIDPFKWSKPIVGDFRNPNIQNQYWDRYAAYGSDYKRLGFSPLRNNEEVYNQHTGYWDDFQRAGSQWWTLTKLSVADSMSWSLDPTDTETAEEFSRAMAIGSSSRGGFRGSAINMFLSSGYTFGVLGTLAIEGLATAAIEAGLATLTAPTAGASLGVGAGLAAKFGANSMKAFTKLKKALRVGEKLKDSLDNMKDVNKARQFFMNAGKIATDFVNPLDNTVDFLRTMDKMDDVGDTVKAFRGFTAVYSDLRNMRLAWGESTMEGGMVENEINDELLQRFYDENGRYPDEQEGKRIGLLVKTAGTKTTLQNFPLIFFSNKITLGALTRGPFKKLYSDVVDTGLGKKMFYKKPKAPGQKAYTAAPKEFLKRQWTYFRDPKTMLRAITTYGLDNVMEGGQEVAQEIISGTNLDYYKAQYEPDAIKGGYYDYLLSNVNGMMSPKGAETFASGFFMQMMVGPISNTIGSAKNGVIGDRDNLSEIIGGGIHDLGVRASYITKPQKWEEYKAHREEIKKVREEQFNKDLNTLNDLADRPQDFITKDMENLMQQGKLIEALDAAELSNDKKAFHDFKDSASFQHIATAIRYNRTDTLLERLEDLKTLSDEDLKADKIDPAQYRARIDETIKRAKSVEARIKYLHERHPNNIDPNRIKDPNRRKEAALRKKAYDDAIEEAAFNQYTFDRTLERHTSILKKIQKTAGLDNANYGDLSILLDVNSLSAEITKIRETLKTQGVSETVEKSKTGGPITEELKTFVKDQEERAAKLQLFSDVMSNAVTNRDLETDEFKQEDKVSVRKALTDYINYVATKSGDHVNVDNLEDTIQDVMDYHILKGRSIEANNAVNALLDQKGFQNYEGLLTQLHTLMDKQRGEERKESIHKFRDLVDKDDIITKLADAGVAADLDDLEAIENKQTISHITFYEFDRKDPNKEPVELPLNTAEYRKAVDILREKYPNIKDVVIAEREPDGYYTLRTRTKYAEDKRTYADLAKIYGFNPTADSSQVSVKQVLETMRSSDNTFLTEEERLLVDKLLELVTDNEHITFRRDASTPGKYSKGTAEQTVIDARYSSSDHAGGDLPLEVVILQTEIQRRTVESLSKDKEFKKKVEALRKQAEEAYSNLTAEQQREIFDRADKRSEEGLRDNESFVTEVMSNPKFRRFLAGVETPEDTEVKNGWQHFVDLLLENLKKIIKRPNGTVLNAALGVITSQIEKSFGKQESLGKTSPEAVGNKRSVAGLKANHPELLKRLLDQFRESNKLLVDNDAAPFLVNMDSITDDKLVDTPEFAKFLADPTHASKELLLSEYDEQFKTKSTTKGEKLTWEMKYRPVSKEEYADFDNNGAVSNIRIVQMVDKKINNVSFSKEEEAMLADSAVSERFENLRKARAEEPTKTAITAKEELRDLGYTVIGQGLEPYQVRDILADGITLRERLDLQKDPPSEITKERMQELEDELLKPIEKANPKELKELEEQILAMLSDNDLPYNKIPDIGTKLKEAIDRRKLLLVGEVNFDNIFVGDKVMLKNKNYIAKVTEKTNDTLTVEYVNDEDELVEKVIKKKNLRGNIKYMYNIVMEEVDIKDTPEITEEDIKISNESMKIEDVDSDEIIAEDVKEYKASSKEDTFNDLINSICKK